MTHPTKLRRKCFDYWKQRFDDRMKLVCQGCQCILDPVRDQWEADHEIVKAHGGSDDPPNVRPLCVACHKEKTGKRDLPAIAKGKRGRDQHYGIKRSAKPMPHGRNSPTKRKLSGEVVPR